MLHSYVGYSSGTLLTKQHWFRCACDAFHGTEMAHKRTNSHMTIRFELHPTFEASSHSTFKPLGNRCTFVTTRCEPHDMHEYSRVARTRFLGYLRPCGGKSACVCKCKPYITEYNEKSRISTNKHTANMVTFL